MSHQVLKVGVSTAVCPPVVEQIRELTVMVVIGIDPHKRTHTASALDQVTHQRLDSVQIEATIAGYRSLLRWAEQYEQRQWAVENAHGLGRHVAQWLIARGQIVVDVPTVATARVRELSRGGRRKTDVLDAAAAASVAALHGDTNPVAAEGLGTVLAMLDERRANLTAARTRLVNQLHALLRDLLPGGAPTELTADKATALLRGLRVAGPVEHARRDLARDLIAEIRATDNRLTAGARRMSEVLREHGSRLPTVAGVGPVLASRLIGRTGKPSRFPSASAFANYVGVAPIELASGGRARHRLSRYGDRQLNAAIHYVALTQARMTGSPGRAYYDRKIAEGKTRNEAMRCLKRRLADHLWRIMITDERRAPGTPRTVRAAA